MTTKRELLDDPNSCLNKAADDEPVFLLRAQDMLAPGRVESWADVANNAGCEYSKVRGAYMIAAAMRKWPNRKLPD